MHLPLRRGRPDPDATRSGIPRVRSGLRPSTDACDIHVLRLDLAVLGAVSAAPEDLGNERANSSLGVRHAGGERGVRRLDTVHEGLFLRDGQSGRGRGENGRENHKDCDQGKYPPEFHTKKILF